MKEIEWDNLSNNENEININDLYVDSNYPIIDDAEEELDNPTLILNLDEINEAARQEATEITERLSNYYFDEKYLEEHPYLRNKIGQEINNIRRLLKMLSVNEAAQDSLIQNITINAGKGSLYQSLTSLQNTTLSIQAQLNKLTNDVEEIFKEMQENCEKTFEEKDLEEDEENGTKRVRGSREFINSLIQRGITQNKKQKDKENDSQQLSLFTEQS